MVSRDAGLRSGALACRRPALRKAYASRLTQVPATFSVLSPQQIVDDPSTRIDTEGRELLAGNTGGVVDGGGQIGGRDGAIVGAFGAAIAFAHDTAAANAAAGQKCAVA